MGMEMGIYTLCIVKKIPHKWVWRHFGLAKSSLYMGVETLCTLKKAHTFGDRDTLH